MEENGVSDLLPSAEDTIQTKARKWESSRPTQGGAHQGASQPSGVQKGGDGFSLEGQWGATDGSGEGVEPQHRVRVGLCDEERLYQETGGRNDHCRKIW